MVYLGEKFGFYAGIDDLELIAEIYDLRNAIIDLVYPFRQVNRTQEEFEVNVEAHSQSIAPKFYKKLEAILEMRGFTFMLRDSLCVADFHIFEMIDQTSLMAAKYGHTDPVDAFPKLAAYYKAIKALPELAGYFASPKYKLPCNSALDNAYFA
mmetsp:Transcript_8678/g.22168  ORF Transcript_8678/g.22168 Transcript_8678/m.22168 type:complete len:153 (-) Transcript_8678:166-624(-)